MIDEALAPAPRRVAVVDDDPDDRALAARALRRELPETVVEEIGSEEALFRVLERPDLDAVVTDYHLKWSDGLRVLRATKARLPDVPVILFTNTGNENVAVEAMKLGAHDYVVKAAFQYARLPAVVLAAHELRRARLGERVRAEEARRHHAEREHLLVRERAARAAAEHANRLKDEFLASVSHELRTPLNAILGWAVLLASREDVVNPVVRRGLATIERNARAQTLLIEDLLDMSRIVSGTLRVDLRTVAVGSVVSAAVQAVAPTAEAKRIRIQVHREEGDVVRADPERLEQIFVNLLGNAVKFSPEDSSIDVHVGTAAGRVEVRVVDRGLGIAPEFLARVFDRFRQADGTTTRKHGGLGLGLAIAKELVQLHGGDLRVTSEGLGRGATFTVSLPAKLEDGAPASLPGSLPMSREPATTPLRGVRVVVLDDDRDTCDIIERALESAGATVWAAEKSDDAVALVASMRPDVLLSDIGLAGEPADGYAVLRRVRALGATSGGDVPAVALTAYVRDEDVRRALEAGFAKHVGKPVTPGQIVAAVAEVAAARGSEVA